MNQPPLNPDEIRAAALANRHAILDEEFWGFSSESDAQDYGFEQGAKWAAQRLAAALPEVTSVEELDQLPEVSIILHDEGFAVLPAKKSFDDGHWYVTGSNEYRRTDTLAPARVIHRPEVKP